MLPQNSVERILQGVAKAIDETVVPHLNDRFAAMQAKAMVELLRNVSVRVEWRCSSLIEENRQISDLLTVLERAGWQPAADPDVNTAAVPGTPGEEQRRLLTRLAAGIQWLEGQTSTAPTVQEAREALRSFLLSTFEADGAMMRTGMFK
jgi:hypothetical protein